MKPWQKEWSKDIQQRERKAWEAFQRIYGENATFREWTVFLSGWRAAKETQP